MKVSLTMKKISLLAAGLLFSAGVLAGAADQIAELAQQAARA